MALCSIPAALLVLREGGVAAATMAATCDGEYCGIFDFAARPEFKRRGLAGRMIGAAAQWGAQGGARWLFAEVAASNTAPRGLHAGIDVVEQYRYCYFVRG